MKIGSVFDQTSTSEFVIMLDQQFDSEKLLFSYLELSPSGDEPNPEGERIISRIISIHKENPLLSRDQAGVSASVDLGDLGFEFSRRFTYGWAKCSVIGTLNSRGTLDMNRRVVAPNAGAFTPSEETLRQLFFDGSPSFLPIGSVETYGDDELTSVPVTLNGDQLVTKHFCVFGMTGSGKTNTGAKILEELMARGHRMVIFDSHDDYQNLENFENLRSEVDSNGETIELNRPDSFNQLINEAIEMFTPSTHDGREISQVVEERLLRSASVILNNVPIRQLIQQANQTGEENHLSNSLLQLLNSVPKWQSLIANPQVTSYECFPELKHYGDGFEDFTINLLAAFQGELFSAAQWRCLRQVVQQQGTGIEYLRNLWRAIHNANVRQETRAALEQMVNGMQAIYHDAINSGTEPIEIDRLFRQVADRENCEPQTVYRLSLSDLSSNLRKAMVYAVVTYFFRMYKYGNYRVRPTVTQHPAHPVLFVLEEARALVPKSSGLQDVDASGYLARRAMRELAYEGRKFSIGYGLISQKPSTVDQEVVSQSNTFILHQLKSPDDQQYVRSVTESMSSEELEMIKSLGTGRAIVAGIAVRSPVLLRVFFRYSKEGIAEPTPLRDELGDVETIRQGLFSDNA